MLKYAIHMCFESKETLNIYVVFGEMCKACRRGAIGHSFMHLAVQLIARIQIVNKKTVGNSFEKNV